MNKLLSYLYQLLFIYPTMSFDINNKKKKQTKTAKQWRKEINVDDEQKLHIKSLDDKIKANQIDKHNDFDFVVEDVKPLPKGFLNKKTQPSESYDKLLEKESRKIRQIQASKEFIKEPIKSMVDKDLWADEHSATTKDKPINKTSLKEIKYPKVVLPHPGLSYNPKKEDTKHLLAKVVEMHKGILLTKEFEESQSKLKGEPITKEEEFLSESENDKEEKTENATVTVNVADDVKKAKQPRALTKTERNRKIKKKLNKLQTVRAIGKKRTRNDINNIIGIKKFTNILNANKKKIEKKQKRVKREELKHKEQLLQGHIDE